MMGDVTGISWTDSTFNPWIGCTKIGPGCDHCYAETEDARRQWGGARHWGAGVARHRTSVAYWKNPVKWNRDGWRRVFCASLADVFDNEVPQEWRDDLFAMIEATPRLTWQLLTKRIGNVMGMVPHHWKIHFPPNVWMGATVVTQTEFDHNLPKLWDIPASIRWLSIEPQIETIHMGRWAIAVQWVITGGESGPNARPYDIEWARSIIKQCREAGVAPFVKQLGSRAGMKHRAGADPAEWPLDLQVQEFPQ